MNIVQLQKSLQSVPDQALIGYVQNPQGQVPSYLALTELNRRKEMRSAAQQAQAPQATVAQEVVQQAQPQQMAPQGIPGLAGASPKIMEALQRVQPQSPAGSGVGQLPVPDHMFNEQTMAGGGIVAFSGKDGSEVQADDEPTSWLGRNIGTPLKNWYQREHDQMMAADALEAYQAEHHFAPWEQSTQSQRDQYAAGEKPFQQQLDNARRGIFSSNTPQQYPSDNKIPGSNVVPPGGANPADTAKLAADAAKPAAEVDPFAQLKKQLTPGTPEKQKSAKEYMDDYKAILGEDPNAQAAKDRIAKLSAKADEREKNAGWMALAKAGFAMAAGKSPHALQNIAEGATAGVTDYASAQDKLEQLREKHVELQSQLDRQARAEQISAATYGVNSKEHQDDRAARERTENKQLGTQLAIAQLNYGLNASTKAVEGRSKAEAAALALFKGLHPDAGIGDTAELQAEYNKILQQKAAEMGVTLGAPVGSTSTSSGATIQPDKSGEWNYIKAAAK